MLYIIWLSFEMFWSLTCACFKPVLCKTIPQGMYTFRTKIKNENKKEMDDKIKGKTIK